MSRITHDLVNIYSLLRKNGINDSHSGNASVRTGDILWITPTSACADTLRPWELVGCVVDSDAACAGASSDLALHRAVYRRNPRASAVLHGHGVHATALTLDGRDFEPVDLEGWYYFGERVPVIDLPYDEYFSRSPALVAAALAEHRVTIVRGHGLYAWGETLDLAYKWLCSLELAATVKYLGQRAGTLTGRDRPAR